MAHFRKSGYKRYSFALSQDIYANRRTSQSQDKQHVRRFVDIPYRLYKNHPQWVPPLRMDVELMLNKQKHPFYEHSDADFFIAAA